MTSKPNTFVTTVDTEIEKQLRHDLEEQGFSFATPPYSLFAAKKKGVSCTLYQSGKLVVQGKEMSSFIEFYLEPQILKSFDFSYRELNLDKTARIGIDESGKGDFFGPLCIAGLFAGGDDVEALQKIGVADSKKINDKKILTLAKEIRSNFDYHVIKIGPAKYNELYSKFRNLNRLLAWGHATAIETLMEKTGCQNVIIDQFAAEHVVETALKNKGLSPNLKQRHRAEEDVVVAGASILARATFLDGINQLSKQYGVQLHKGASPQVIQAGREIVRKHGPEILTQVGKVHFKTYNDILC